MDVEWPKAAAEGLVLLGRQRLVAEEDHLVVEEGLADRAEGAVVKLLRQIDTKDFRAQRAAHSANFEFAHAVLPNVCRPDHRR